MNKKAIVIFDTNKLLQNSDDKRYYSSIDLGGYFYMLTKEFLPENSLSDNVVIAVSKLSIEEIKQRKIEDFDSKFQSIESRYKKIIDDIDIVSNLITQNMGAVTKLETAYEIMTRALDEYISKQSIVIIDYPKNDNLPPIIQRALKRKTPFLKTVNDGSDKGFKDVVIWHSIMEYDKLTNYDYHILFTGDGGFDKNCQDEFGKKFGKKLIKVDDFQDLKNKLLEIYPEDVRRKIEVKSRVSEQYFQDQLSDFIKTVLEKYNTIKYFSIVDKYIDSEIVDYGYELTTKIRIVFADDIKPPVDIQLLIYLSDIFEIEAIDEPYLDHVINDEND